MAIQPDPAKEKPVELVRTLADLRERGHISPQYIERWTRRWSNERGEFNYTEGAANNISLLRLQQEVFSKEETFCWPGKNLLITGPGSAGKTFIAEALMASVVSQFQLNRQKCIYAVPLRALADEKYETFQKIFDPDITAVSSADHREHDEQILKGRKRIIVVVYEKLYLWLAHPKRYRNLLDNTALLVVDELHLLGNPERGAKLEMILTWARDYQARNPAPVGESLSGLRIVGMAPDKRAVENMQSWLDAVTIHCGPETRPTPLIEGVVTLDNTISVTQAESTDEVEQDLHEIYREVEQDLHEIYREVEQINKAPSDKRAVNKLQARRDDIRTTHVWDNFISVCVKHYIAKGKKVLVYRSSKGTAEHIALLLEKQLPLRTGKWHTVEQELMALEYTHAREQLNKTMPKGIGFHHGDMTPEERKLVESQFRGETLSGFSLDVIVATPTLGMGINLPADVVIMADPTTFHIQNPDSRKVIPERLSVLEYKNYASRAGRFKWDEPDRYGICILLGESAEEAKHTLTPLIIEPAESIDSTLMKPMFGIEPYVLATAGWLEGGGQPYVDHQQFMTLFTHTYAAAKGYSLQPLIEDKLASLTGLTDPDAEILINPDTHGLVGTASVAARAAISMRTYQQLIELQKQLGDLLDTPLALLYKLATTEEVSRLYPTATDWGKRKLAAETARNLHAYYTKLRDVDKISVGEGIRIFLDKMQGTPDNYTLEYLVRAAAAWSWLNGESAPALDKTKAFPGVRWGHLSDLGENFSAMVEILGSIWYEMNWKATNEERQHMIHRVRLLSLQLRHGVPAGVEEVASLKVKGWHRLNLLRLREKLEWEHPEEISHFKLDDQRIPQDLRENLSELQQMIKIQPSWYQDPRPIWQRQYVSAKYHFNLLPSDIDPRWPDLISDAYQKKTLGLEPVIHQMLSSAPFSFACEYFDQQGVTGRSRVDLVLYLTEDRSQCICIEIKTKTVEKGVSWEEASHIMQKNGPRDCEVVNRVTIASPYYHSDVRTTFENFKERLLLFTIEAFVQACLTVLRDPDNREKFIDFLREKTGLYETASDVDRDLSPDERYSMFGV